MKKFFLTTCTFLFRRIDFLRLVATLLFSLLCFKVSSQSKEYKFQIVLQTGNGRTNVFPNFSLLFDNSVKQSSHQEGMVFYTPPTGAKEVKIKSLNENEYVILGSDVIGLPGDPEQTTTIVIYKISTAVQAVKEYTSLLKKMNLTLDALDSLKQINTSRYEKLSNLNDSILSIVTRNYNISAKDLKTTKEIMDGRDKYFNVISFCLEGYLNEGKDVKDCYRLILKYSLENPYPFKQLDSVVRMYNYFYNLLNNNYREYEASVKNYWQSAELSNGFHNIYDFAINNIHKPNILPLNDSVTLKTNMYIHEKSKKKREQLKVSLSNSLNSIIPILENNLNILDSKIKDYIVRLELQKDFSPQ